MPKDACYHKVSLAIKSYASGAIAKCRKVGALALAARKRRRLKVVLYECPMVVARGVASFYNPNVARVGIVKRRKVTKKYV